MLTVNIVYHLHSETSCFRQNRYGVDQEGQILTFGLQPRDHRKIAARNPLTNRLVINLSSFLGSVWSTMRQTIAKHVRAKQFRLLEPAAGVIQF